MLFMEHRINSGLGDVYLSTLLVGLLSSYTIKSMLFMDLRISSGLGDLVPKTLLAGSSYYQHS